ncbi:MAG TPA: porin [Pirellulaceae bacterium]|nr:porin [Pirellulaceae bacterium]
MRLSNLLAGCCMATAAVALGGSVASAQQAYYGGSVAPVAYNWGGDVMGPSCVAGPTCCEEPGCCADPNSCSGYGGGCGAGGCGGLGLFGGGACRGGGHGPACNPDCESWELMQRSCNGWKVGGWLQGGIYANDRGIRGTSGNGPIAFNQLAGEFALHQGWVYLDRELNTDDGFGWGAHADYIYGIDAADTSAFGDASWDYTWQTSRDGTRQGYGSAIPQAYGQVGYGDLNVKVGKFFTIMGYEVVQATGNFFYSHAYTMNYGEPFTHTGALAEYKPSDDVTLWGGYTFGWDTGFNNYTDSSTFLGGISYTGIESVTATYTTNFGYFGDGTGSNLGGTYYPGNAGDIWVQSIVIIVDLNDRLQYVAQSDFGSNTIETVGGAPGSTNTWYGANQYLFYTINDCWRAGVRYEWFYDDARDSGRSRVGFGENEYQSITAGLNWTPHTNVTIRPEARWDWIESHGGTGPFPVASGPVFGDPSIFAYGVDAIFTY